MSDSNTWSWLLDGANWRSSYGQVGIAAQLGHHLEYSVIALAIALALGLPLGLLIGHTGRATYLVSVVNGVRALPSIGLLILFYVILAPHFHGRGSAVFLIPTEIVLVLLAVPPILANAYAGVQNVGEATRDAARGMGMTGGQVLWQVEFPNALPLIFSGARSAALQVISTATVAAYVGLGGLGRFVYDGLANHDLPQVVGGAVLVAALALAADLALALAQRYTTSRGLTGRFARGRAVPDGPGGAEQLAAATT